MAEIVVKEGGVLQRFLDSRTKIQIFGGGYGNGKTTGAVTKGLQLMNDYPGMNSLWARETYPKLNDTLRAEFIKWCPKDWIESFPLSVNASNTCTLTNGSKGNFRYIAQQGKGTGDGTSNLLSATYDLVVVDQMEDPGISHKDFLDLLGRLRGNTIYRGDDPAMPRTGPRWFIITVNPTRNWVWKELIEPLKLYQERGIITDKLLCIRNGENNAPVLDEEGKPYVLIELFEAATYENKHNLGADFIQLLESAYTGQMKDRFLKGLWASYEGLIYPQFDQITHMVDEKYMRMYLEEIYDMGYDLEWEESYDYGLAVPSCYLLSCVDHNGYIHVVDGFYQKEMELAEQAHAILAIRDKWKINKEPIDTFINGDPAIFKRTQGKTNEKISDIFFADHKIKMTPADNSIASGIQKVSGYVTVSPGRQHPYNLDMGAPLIYFASHLQFLSDEFAAYMWGKGPDGKAIDEPADHQQDHGMDAVKYLLTRRPYAAQIKPSRVRKIPAWLSWQESEVAEQRTSRRYG